MARGKTKKKVERKIERNIYDNGQAFIVRFLRKGEKINKNFSYEPGKMVTRIVKDEGGKPVEETVTSRQAAKDNATTYRNAQWNALVGKGKRIEQTTQLTLRTLFQRYRLEVTLGLKREADPSPEAIKVALKDKDSTKGKKGKGPEWDRIGKILREDIFKRVLDTPLVKLSRHDFESLRDALEKEGQMQPESINRLLSIFSGVFKFGMDQPEYEVAENLAAGVRLKVKERPQLRVPRTDELELLLEKTESNSLRLALLLALETGARRGELAGLTWADVVLSGDEYPHLAFRETKNDSARSVPLSPQAIKLLKAYDSKARHGWLFPSPKKPGEPITPHAISRAFKRARERLEEDGVAVPDLRFHGARGRFITDTAQRVDVLHLAKVTGHKNLNVLHKRYYQPDAQQLAEKLGFTSPKKKRAAPRKPAAKRTGTR